MPTADQLAQIRRIRAARRGGLTDEQLRQIARITGSQAPFTPFVPGAPPRGLYDPAIDAALGASDRGLKDTLADINRSQERLTTDYELGRGRIAQDQARGTQDIGTQRTYGTQDYERNLGDLARAYSRLATRQGEQANAMGVLHSGAALQSAAKRAASMAHDREGLDVGYQRLIAGLDTGQSRLNEDATAAFGDLALQSAPPDAGNPVGGRAWQDLVTTGTRAEREALQFQRDQLPIQTQQAVANGWDPYALRPANESGAPGQEVRTIQSGGQAVTVAPSGRIITQTPTVPVPERRRRASTPRRVGRYLVG